MKVDPTRSPGYKIGHDNAGEFIPSPQKRQCLTYPTYLPVLGYLYLPNVEKVSLRLPDRVPPDPSTSWSRDTTPPYPKSVLWSVLLLHVHATCTCASSCICLPPESWSVNLVSSWLINQLAQGKDSTVKVYKGQNKHTYTTGHWWFIRYKQICYYYTSDTIILLIKIIHFIIYDDEISHFHHTNTTKYHIFHIYTIYKYYKNIK